MSIFKALRNIAVIAVCVFCFVLPQKTQAATLYFYSDPMSGTANWADSDNWFTDSGHTTPAGVTPTLADDVIVYSAVNVNYSMSGPEANSAEFRGADAVLGVALTVTNGASFYDTSSISGMGGSVTGTAKFYDSSVHYGIIYGNGEFYDTSTNSGSFMGSFCMALTAFNYTMTSPTGECAVSLYFTGEVNGDWSNSGNWWSDALATIPANPPTGTPSNAFILAEVTSNSGMAAVAHTITFRNGSSLRIPLDVSDAITFEDASANESTVTFSGTTFFTDSSTNNGTTTGNAAFTDSSINNHVIGGDATFRNFTANNGTVIGDACFGDSAVNNGTAGNVSVCRETKYFAASVNQDWNELGNWYDDAAFTVPSMSLPDTTNNVVVNSVSMTYNMGMSAAHVNKITFNGTAILYGFPITVDEIAVFNDTSDMNMSGQIFGEAEFNDSASMHSSQVVGNASFYDTSTNLGNITGDACFDPTATNLGIVTGVISVCGVLAPRTMYFKGDIDSNWNTLGNWYDEASFTQHSSYLPNSLDDVYLPAVRISSNTGAAISVKSITLTGTSSIGVAVTVSELVTFNDASYNNGANITGNARFNTTYYNNGVTATSTVMTFANTVWYGSISGTVKGANNDTITMYVFNGTSTSRSNITGNVVYNDMSYNNGSNITGNARFNTGYYNNGTPTTSAVMTLLNTTWNGTVSAVVSGSTGVTILSYVFNGTSTNSSTITGNAEFQDTSVNNGTVTGSACIGIYATNNGTVNGGTSVCPYLGALTLYYGGMTTGDWSSSFSWKLDDGTFAVSSPRAPIAIDNVVVSTGITGNTGLFPTVVNASFVTGGFIRTPFIVTGLATFNNNSYASGTSIIGNVMFKDTSRSINMAIYGNACFEAGTTNTNTIAVGGSLSVCGVAPIASSIVGVPSASTATVTWSTDKYASSSVRYGLTTSYGSVSSSTATTSHSATLSGLLPLTTYHYQILSIDVWGNTSVSGDGTFITSAAPVSSSEQLSIGAWSAPTGGSSGSSGGYTTIAVPVLNPTTTTTVTTVTPAPSTSVSTYIFTRTLTSNNTHPEVKTLQQFLNAHGFTVAKTGAGSVGKETTKFGPATKAALIRFQKAYKITPAVGFFGPVTRGVMEKVK